MTSSEDLAAGLGVDRMHPPEFEAFFGGLARRVTALALRALPDKPENESADPGRDGEEPSAEVPSPDQHKTNREAAGGFDPTDELILIVDAIDQLINRTKDVGFATDPDATAADTDLAELEERSPDVAGVVLRIEAGAIEVTRRLAGLSSTAWQSNSDLVDQVRATVVDIVGPIRAVERRIDQQTDT